MAQHYTVRQIVELTDLSDTYVRRILRENKIKEAYKHKRGNTTAPKILSLFLINILTGSMILKQLEQKSNILTSLL